MHRPRFLPLSRPPADAGGWRVLVVIALASLAAAMMVLGARSPEIGTELHCFPLTQAPDPIREAGPRPAPGAPLPRPSGASWASACSAKLALAEESFVGRAGIR